ncbi:MAG: tail protein X [Clostridia bacterium]|nr:tail protein X [Clostridia bacterium]
MSKIYTTIQGDMWDSISYKVLGDVKYTDALINANPELHDIYVFESGVKILIPDIELSEISSELPPWRK